ncbi:MAG: LamG-like jellyroll fold domain-containing protein, partial [Planctomycetota bacterium]
GAAEPTVKVPTTQQLRQLEQLAARQQQLSAAWDAHQQSLDQRLAAWEAKLTDDERQKLGPSDLQLHLPLDERDGAPVMDRAAMPPRALTVVGKAHWTEGRVRGALKLDGQTYLEGGSSAALAADRPFTIAIWLRTANDGVAAVLSKMDDAGAFRGYDITLENGRVALHLIDHWPDDAIKVQTKNSVEQPGWHQLTITYDGSRRAAGVTLYWDGKAQELEWYAIHFVARWPPINHFTWGVGKAHCPIAVSWMICEFMDER